MIRFTCPSCRTLLQTKEEQGGVTVGCPNCKSQMKVPAPVALPTSVVPTVSNMIRFTCPSCKKLLQTGDDQSGVIVGCPNCKSQMKVPAPVALPASIVPTVSNTAGTTQMGRPTASPSSSQPLAVRLRELLAKHGSGLCADARRCESLIRDICGDKTKEVHLLIQALKQRVPEDLLAMPKGASPMPILERLRKRLEDRARLG